MSLPGDVPPTILNRLRPICRQLPESYEEPAWIGVRWRIRARTFAHVYSPDAERHPVYAPYVAANQDPVVMTFRASMDDLLGLTDGGFPFLRADWGHNVVAAVLGDHTDWAELTELITDSYREMAPKFLAAKVTLPPTPPAGNAPTHGSVDMPPAAVEACRPPPCQAEPQADPSSQRLRASHKP